MQLWKGLLVCVLVAVAGPAYAQKRPVTNDDVLAMKSVGSPAVSPDGQLVLYTVRQWEAASEQDKDRMESRTRVWRVAVSGDVPARQLTYGERDDQPQWSPDGRYISFVSTRGNGDEARPQIYLMRTDGGEAWKLTEAKEGVGSYSWAPDSSRIAFVTTDPRATDQETAIKRRDDERVFEGDFRYDHIWVMDIESRTATRVTDGTNYTVSGAPSWAPDGARFVFGTSVTPMIRDYRDDIYVADVASKQVEKISTNFGVDAQPRWSPDGKWIAWTSEPNPNPPGGDGTPPAVIMQSHLMLYDVGAKKAADVSSADFDIDMGTPRWSADGRRVFFTSGKRTYIEVFAYDLATRTYTQLTERRTLQIGSASRDGQTVAVTMDTPETPAEICVTDASFQSFRRLTDTNPQAAEFALGETEVVTWKNDGFEVEGVLLKPVGYTAGTKYPMLVVAHGGPAGAYTNNYRVGGLEGGQVWAGMGWAVFYPNPRGSTNYGDKFLKANINDWGGGDYRDIMTGVDMLVARGIADPDRLAHIGWSYGGYMTAWVITQTSRFKAAMVGAGLTDMWSMYGTNDIPNLLVGYFGGIPNAQTLPLYSARSAMSHIDKVTTPTLILHGASDDRVPVGQALELYRGLKDRGKTVELVFYPREPHGFREYYHQKDRMERIQAWVTRYTPRDNKKTSPYPEP